MRKNNMEEKKEGIGSIFTEVGSVLALKSNKPIDLGEDFKPNTKLTLVSCKDGITTLKATPWGVGVAELILIHNDRDKIGLITILPKFLLHGIDVKLWSGENETEDIQLFLKMYKDIQLSEFIELVQNTISVSDIKFRGGDPKFNESAKNYTLYFMGITISRLYFTTGYINFKSIDSTSGKTTMEFSLDLNFFNTHSIVQVKKKNIDNGKVTIKKYGVSIPCLED